MYAYCENNPVNRADYTGAVVFGLGFDISGAFGARAGMTYQIVVDDEWNVGLLVTSSSCGGTPQASLTGVFSVSNADTIYDTQGKGLSIGGSAAVGCDFTVGTAQNGDPVYGGQLSWGISALPYEMHGDITETKLYTWEDIKYSIRDYFSDLLSDLIQITLIRQLNQLG